MFNIKLTLTLCIYHLFKYRLQAMTYLHMFLSLILLYGKTLKSSWKCDRSFVPSKYCTSACLCINSSVGGKEKYIFCISNTSGALAQISSHHPSDICHRNAISNQSIGPVVRGGNRWVMYKYTKVGRQLMLFGAC